MTDEGKLLNDSSPAPGETDTRRRWVGQSVRRIEDHALLVGKGQFIDDLEVPDAAHGWFVRSTHAHARIVAVDTQTAASAPGVLAVLTGADAESDELGALPGPARPVGRDGSPAVGPRRPGMATHTVHHVGEIVALVIATTEAQAREAAERIEVEYDELPCVTDPLTALEATAPVLWPDVPGNLALDWEGGDAGKTDAAFASAAHVTRLAMINNRVIIAAMETRGVIASFDPATDRYTVHTPSQGASELKGTLAGALGVPADRVRVTTPDVGGAFGMKMPLYVEHVLLAWAARRTGRQIKWIDPRADSFVSDLHGRDHYMDAALALDADGRFLGVRCETSSNAGAYAGGAAPVIATVGGTRCITGVYVIAAWHARVRIVLTNTGSVGPYRGAGKPEYNYLIERLVDAAARELDLDPVELRRLNAIPPQAMPFDTGTGITLDSGEFVRNMDEALELAGHRHVAERRQDAQSRGKLYGFGIAMFQEPDGFLDNRVCVSVDEHARVVAKMTGQTGGHGHATTFSQVLADELQVPMDRIEVRQGDSDELGPGRGSGGSRTATLTSAGMVQAARAIVEKCRLIAAHMVEASPLDIEFVDGAFRVAGTDREVSVEAVARVAYGASDLDAGPDLEPGLEEEVYYVAEHYNFPCGCHTCELEIDPETGAIALLGYHAVDDHGVELNPVLLEGQLHGGVVQGIGQALLEDCRYDPDSGQLLTGSFMDYTLPRADDLPPFVFKRRPTPCKTNPLGVKGVGESGCAAAPAAVVNAALDALAGVGATRIDMPLTQERVWRAIRDARQ